MTVTLVKLPSSSSGMQPWNSRFWLKHLYKFPTAYRNATCRCSWVLWRNASDKPSMTVRSSALRVYGSFGSMVGNVQVFKGYTLPSTVTVWCSQSI